MEASRKHDPFEMRWARRQGKEIMGTVAITARLSENIGSVNGYLHFHSRVPLLSVPTDA